MKWFRPVFIGLLIITVIIGFFVGLVPSEAFVPFATGLVVYWFKSRDEEKSK